MKPISFPKEEIPKLMKRSMIVTTRVDQEFNKYFLNDVLTTPWGDEFVVTSVQVIRSVNKHPNYTSLTQKQIQLLSKYNKMEVIRMKKVKAQKELYITCGDCCNEYLSTMTDILCVPFNEASLSIKSPVNTTISGFNSFSLSTNLFNSFSFIVLR